MLAQHVWDGQKQLRGRRGSSCPKFDLKAWQEADGGMALVVDMAKAFETLQQVVVWKAVIRFWFTQGFLRVLC